MPLGPKATQIRRKLHAKHGRQKGDRIFFASVNKGTIREDHARPAGLVYVDAASVGLRLVDLKGGRHVAGTPYRYRHGWIPISGMQSAIDKDPDLRRRFGSGVVAGFAEGHDIAARHALATHLMNWRRANPGAKVTPRVKANMMALAHQDVGAGRIPVPVHPPTGEEGKERKRFLAAEAKGLDPFLQPGHARERKAAEKPDSASFAEKDPSAFEAQQDRATAIRKELANLSDRQRRAQEAADLARLMPHRPPPPVDPAQEHAEAVAFFRKQATKLNQAWARQHAEEVRAEAKKRADDHQAEAEKAFAGRAKRRGVGKAGKAAGLHMSPAMDEVLGERLRQRQALEEHMLKEHGFVGGRLHANAVKLADLHEVDHARGMKTRRAGSAHPHDHRPKDGIPRASALKARGGIDPTAIRRRIEGEGKAVAPGLSDIKAAARAYEGSRLAPVDLQGAVQVSSTGDGPTVTRTVAGSGRHSTRTKRVRGTKKDRCPLCQPKTGQVPSKPAPIKVKGQAFGLNNDDLRLIIDLVGPKGFVHGWIKVGSSPADLRKHLEDHHGGKGKLPAPSAESNRTLAKVHAAEHAGGVLGRDARRSAKAAGRSISAHRHKDRLPGKGLREKLERAAVRQHMTHVPEEKHRGSKFGAAAGIAGGLAATAISATGFANDDTVRVLGLDLAGNLGNGEATSVPGASVLSQRSGAVQRDRLRADGVRPGALPAALAGRLDSRESRQGRPDGAAPLRPEDRARSRDGAGPLRLTPRQVRHLRALTQRGQGSGETALSGSRPRNGSVPGADLRLLQLVNGPGRRVSLSPSGHGGLPGEVDLAADSMAKAMTPRRLGTHPLWFKEGFHLPDYIEHVASHFIGSHGKSRGIAMAIGIIKNWAHGHPSGGEKRIHPDTVAAARLALSQWEALKARAKSVKSNFNLARPDTAVVDLVGPKGYIHGWIKVGAGGDDKAARRERALQRASASAAEPSPGTRSPGRSRMRSTAAIPGDEHAPRPPRRAPGRPQKAFTVTKADGRKARFSAAEADVLFRGAEPLRPRSSRPRSRAEAERGQATMSGGKKTPGFHRAPSKALQSRLERQQHIAGIWSTDTMPNPVNITHALNAAAGVRPPDSDSYLHFNQEVPDVLDLANAGTYLHQHLRSGHGASVRADRGHDFLSKLHRGLHARLGASHSHGPGHGGGQGRIVHRPIPSRPEGTKAPSSTGIGVGTAYAGGRGQRRTPGVPRAGSSGRGGKAGIMMASPVSGALVDLADAGGSMAMHVRKAHGMKVPDGTSPAACARMHSALHRRGIRANHPASSMDYVASGTYLDLGRSGLDLAVLKTAKRKSLPDSAFGLPEQRKYPMKKPDGSPDKSHAANAKARAAQMLKRGRINRAQHDKIVAKANRVLGSS